MRTRQLQTLVVGPVLELGGYGEAPSVEERAMVKGQGGLDGLRAGPFRGGQEFQGIDPDTRADPEMLPLGAHPVVSEVLAETV
jgi:hypothetical protein